MKKLNSHNPLETYIEENYPEQLEKEKAVICLGQSFESEDARREYYRGLLRERLPELKKIEGYPIGEDEDIIALSDPPYYTACPNPWLNDFIEEWEKEKLELEKEGLRVPDAEFKVLKPYASDVSEGKNNPIYTAHTYHTKVPHPAIMRYILYYTQPGDLVLDTFCGTGMTGVAAQICGNPDLELKNKIETEWKHLLNAEPKWGYRKAVLGDLSPFASFISYNYNSPININTFNHETNLLLDSIITECSDLYKTKHTNGDFGLINYTVWSDIFLCNNCGNEIVFWNEALDFEKKKILDEFQCPLCKSINSKNSDKSWITIFDNKLNKTIKIAKSYPVYIVYTYKGKRYNKKPDVYDFDLIKQINEQEIKDWYPTDETPFGFNTEQPRKSHGISHIHLFFTKRNLIALSILNRNIEKSKIQRKLRFILTGMIKRSTQMNRIHVSNFFYGGGGWNAGGLAGTLYIPSMQVETSILEQLSDRTEAFKRAILLLKKTYSNIQFIGSATKTMLKENSVDYIFTDPPFGANIMYSELNQLIEGWLKVATNNKKEAIENKAQGKSLLNYQELMTECFKEYYRVLKPNKWITIEFSNTSAAVWNGIQTSLQRAGFIIANVAALDKKQGGMRSITTATAVRQDLIISCYKPSEDFYETFSLNNGEIGVWNFVREHLKHLPVNIYNENKSTMVIERSPKVLYDRLISFYLMRNANVPIDASDFQIGLKQRFSEREGYYFTEVQAHDYDEIKSRIPIHNYYTSIVTNEVEAIEWIRTKLREKRQKYQDIMPDFRIATQSLQKGNILPELQDILNENFIKEEDGSWRVPDMKEIKDREIIRNKVLLKEFNNYLVEINKPGTKKLKEVRLEALRAGFKNCWEKKEFTTIVNLSEKIPQNILLEDEQLLMYYDIAKERI